MRFSSALLGSNGVLGFAGNTNPNRNSCLPTSSLDFGIAPFWDDLNTSCSTYGIFTSISGSAPTRIFNIGWRAVLRGRTIVNDFEVRLYEKLNRVDLVYGKLDSASTKTVGI